MEKQMETKSLDHIGIAVKSIEAALPIFEKGLGMKLEHIEDVEQMKVKTAKLSTGNTIIELIQPLAGEEAVSRFLEKKGEGIHHICLAVADIEGACAGLAKLGFKPIYPQPKTGAGGKKVNFLSPKDACGVLVELCQ
jgi:methylmalonyl-CoA/ethylmalonyl-CoA epimerase